MKTRHWSALALALWAAAGTAHAQSVRRGHLEMRWGDAAPGEPGPRAPQLWLAYEDGSRERVDLDAARAAVGNVYALYGREVEMTLAPGPWPDGLVPRSIVDTTAAWSSPSRPRVSGSQPWITLLCRFPDIGGADPEPPAYFTEMLSNTPGRLDHYWREVSYDKVDLVGSDVAGWFTLPFPRSHYVPDSPNCFVPSGQADLGALWRDCTAAADPSVDFAPFEGINTMYNGDLDGCAWGGGYFGTLDGVTKLWYSTWEPPWGFANEAPLAHEMGHGFGLPHANNSDQDGDPYDNPWDVMSDAWSNANTDGTYGTQPKHISIWSRDHLGWIDAPRKLTIATDGMTAGIVLDRASLAESANVQMIVVTLPAPEPAGHYYVIEARKRVPGYDASLAGTAVIIHEVDENRDEPAWSVDAQVPPADRSNNEGSMFKVGESWTAPGDAFTVDVVAETDEGFVLDLRRGPDLDLIFADGFD